MSGSIEVRIKPKWAVEVAENRGDIWRYNRTNAETIGDELDLPELGGLVISCTDQVYEPAAVQEAAAGRSVVNLAFDEPARLTSTQDLLHAARLSRSPRLIEQLSVRQKPDETHGPNETWALPLQAFEPVID